MAVLICDVGARDGLQNEDRAREPSVRADLCDRLAGAGLKRIEAASFVNPRLVPQMAGAEDVMTALHRQEGTAYAGLVLNEKGYARALAAAGHKVSVAHDGREAAALAKATAFDVIVSDIAMPDMDDLALLRTVRENDLDVPMIFMTGSPNMETIVEALEYGVFRYLTKPVDGPELVSVVERAARAYLGQAERARQENRDIEIINRNADRLNAEAMDVLDYPRIA